MNGNGNIVQIIYVISKKNDKTGNKELLLSNNINNAHAHRKREVRYDTNWTKLVRLQCQNYDEPG